MIAHRGKELIEMDSGLKTMVEHQQIENIRLMYNLFKTSESAMDFFKKFFMQTVRSEGEKLHAQIEGSNLKFDPKHIDKLILTRKKYYDILDNSCNKD